MSYLQYFIVSGINADVVRCALSVVPPPGLHDDDIARSHLRHLRYLLPQLGLVYRVVRQFLAYSMFVNVHDISRAVATSFLRTRRFESVTYLSNKLFSICNDLISLCGAGCFFYLESGPVSDNGIAFSLSKSICFFLLQIANQNDIGRLLRLSHHLCL